MGINDDSLIAIWVIGYLLTVVLYTYVWVGSYRADMPDDKPMAYLAGIVLGSAIGLMWPLFIVATASGMTYYWLRDRRKPEIFE